MLEIILLAVLSYGGTVYFDDQTSGDNQEQVDPELYSKVFYDGYLKGVQAATKDSRITECQKRYTKCQLIAAPVLKPKKL